MIILEKTFEIKPLGVKYICDECCKGEMLSTRKMKMFDNHAEFSHSCNYCKVERYFLEKYPLIRYQNCLQD